MLGKKRMSLLSVITMRLWGKFQIYFLFLLTVHSTSQLRKASQPVLGPQYLGTHVKRKDLYEDQDVDDDPFSRRVNSDLGDKPSDEDEDYDDPDHVDLDFQDGNDEEIDSDDAFGNGDEEIFREKGFTFRDSSKSISDPYNLTSEPPKSKQGSDHASSGEDSDTFLVDGTSDNEELSENATDSDTDATTDTDNDGNRLDEVALRAMMSSQQKYVVAKLSEAMNDEAAKGNAVKKQYTTFDTLVGTRVHLQKSLIAANSMDAIKSMGDDQRGIAEAAAAAETAAIGVLNSLASLLFSIQDVALEGKSQSVLGKRPFSAIVATSSEDINQALSGSHKAFKSHRRQVLTKWENKTRTTTLSTRNRLVQKKEEDSLVTILDGQLLGANQERLMQKTRIARSCAPIQNNNESSSNNRPAIEETETTTSLPNLNSHIPVYDDADFYALLLRELIDHKKTYTKSTSSDLSSAAISVATAPSNLLRNNKSKRVNVDTKASKGRKMKYVVHEKIQNFMAPINLGTWETRQAEELFAGLLGRKIARLEEDEAMGGGPGLEEDTEMQGLRLFGGA